MNGNDLLLQQHLPTLMVPKFEALSALRENASRFLMSAEGLWIESKTAWGRFMKPLYASPRALPYGQVKEEIELFCGTIPLNLVEQFAIQAHQAAKEGLETAAWILWSENKGWAYLELNMTEQSPGSVEFTWPKLAVDQHLVLDMHSHGIGRAFFSSTDNTSDQGLAHFSLVLGLCDIGSVLSEVNSVIRLCLSGFFFDLDLNKVWTRRLKAQP